MPSKHLQVANDYDNGESNSSKRRKLVDASPSIEDSPVVLSTNDLNKLLAFTQNAGPQARTDIQKVKAFIEGGFDPDSRFLDPKVLHVLSGYFKSTVPEEIDETHAALPDLMQTWSFASQFDNDFLFSAITSLLATFLRAISSELTLRSQGTAICQTLLLESQVKLLEKGLKVKGKGKGSLNDACLRLLVEVVTFDGGLCSRSVYRHRSLLFSRLDEFLVLRTKPSGIAHTKTDLALRKHAIDLVLANLRVQESDAKTDILSDNRRGRAIFNHIDQDRPEVALEILQTIDTHFLSDSHVSRSSKSRLLSESNLSKLVSLLRYASLEPEWRQAQASDALKAFITKVCSNKDRGVLIEQNGWYAADSTAERSLSKMQSMRHDGTERNYIQSDEYTERVPVKNTKLAFFIQDLKPYKDHVQLELIIAVFRAAPELVADYFLRRKSFSFEPKPTSTWIGYAGFLFAVSKLDPPPFEAAKGLPNLSVTLENLLPSCTSRKAFNRCFTSSSDLVALLTSKILIASIEKLKRTLRNATALPDRGDGSVWADELIKGYALRLPDIQSILAKLKACHKDKMQQLREALHQLLSLLYETLPRHCMGAKLDVAVPLADALVASFGDASQNPFDLLNIDHLSDVAFHSVLEFDWFHKPDRLALSPFTSVMRLVLKGQNAKLGNILESVVKQHAILQSNTTASAWNTLLQSLQEHQDFEHVLEFLDNCLRRSVQKPVKYEGESEKILAKSKNKTLSLLTVTISEQFPHFFKSHSAIEVKELTSWLVAWINASFKIGESKTALMTIRKDLLECIGDAGSREAILSLSFGKDKDPANGIVPGPKPAISEQPLNGDSLTHGIDQIATQLDGLYGLGEEPENFPQLLRWSRKDVMDAVEEGDVAALIHCLCAGEKSVRVQAETQLSSLAAKISASSYPEKQQLHLLMMELVETSKQWGINEPLPTFVCAFAALGISVLNEPTHFFYPKLNRFLLRAPEWDPGHLPSYWRDKVFAKPPAKDDSYEAEASWLCKALIAGLKSAKDFDIYRRRQIFETLLLRYDFLGISFKETVIGILWRCTYISGASTTLITRCAIMSWCNNHHGDQTIQALKRRILSTCDTSRVKEWSAGSIYIDP